MDISYPKTEKELEQLIERDEFRETHNIECKRMVGGKRNSRERSSDSEGDGSLTPAKMVCALAEDGGIVLVGVDEDKPTGEFFLHPLLLEGVTEAIEKGTERIRPEVHVDQVVIRCESDPERGYVMVHVPDGLGLPHHVDGKYFSRRRKGTTTIRLDDKQIQERTRAHEQAKEDPYRHVRSYREVRRPVVPVEAGAMLYFTATPVLCDTPVDVTGVLGVPAPWQVLSDWRNAAASRTGRGKHLIGAAPNGPQPDEPSWTIRSTIKGPLRGSEPFWEYGVTRDGQLQAFARIQGPVADPGCSTVTCVGDTQVIECVHLLVELLAELDRHIDVGVRWLVALQLCDIAGMKKQSHYGQRAFSSEFTTFTKDYEGHDLVTSRTVSRTPGTVTETLIENFASYQTSGATKDTEALAFANPSAGSPIR